MTDGIGRIFGGNSYGVGGYVPQKHEEAPQNQPAEVPALSYEDTQIAADRVMDILAQSNIFVPETKTSGSGEVDAATEARVAGYMEQFELIYGIIVNEFGEELAPAVMNAVMDRLMGLEFAA